MFTAPLQPLAQYRHVGVASDVAQANPHQLVTLLFDGAIAAVLQARHAIEQGDLETKISTISRGMRIIDEGLKAAVESRGDVALGDNLRALYDHMLQRMLLANVRNADEPLAEVAKLLADLRSTWAEIAPAPAAALPAHLQA
jgi:flagellar secretion chaperone FliS